MATVFMIYPNIYQLYVWVYLIFPGRDYIMKISLKEKIQQMEQELQNLIRINAKTFYINKKKDEIKKLYFKRDEIFARHNAQKNNKILLRDIPVKVYQLPDYKKPEQKKKEYINVYLKDHLPHQ